MFLAKGSHSVASFFPVIPILVKRKRNKRKKKKQGISELRWVNILFNGDQKVLDLSNEDYFSSIIWCVLLCYYLPMLCPGFTHWVLVSWYVSKNCKKVTNSCFRVLRNIPNNKWKQNICGACCIREWYGSFIGKKCFQVKREDKYFFRL